jgi:putative exporter of polyketide antibiotics
VCHLHVLMYVYAHFKAIKECLSVNVHDVVFGQVGTILDVNKQFFQKLQPFESLTQSEQLDFAVKELPQVSMNVAIFLISIDHHQFQKSIRKILRLH